MNDMGTLFGPWRFTWTEADAVRWAAIIAEDVVATSVEHWDDDRLAVARELRLAVCAAPDSALRLDKPRLCDTCAGEGMVEVMVCYGGRPFEQIQECEDCAGTGLWP